MADFVPQRRSFEQLLADKKALGDLQEIVTGLLARQTFNIFVGDSTIGKTPFTMQLGLCVAFGIPFLDQPVNRGRVLVVDYENHDPQELLESLAEHLHIPLPFAAEWFAILSRPNDLETVGKEIQDFKPMLIIVDSLRGFWPQAEHKAKDAAELIKWCGIVSQKFDCAWAVIHHTRKRDRKAQDRPDLLKDPVVEWLEEASGSRALINQSFTRGGFDRPVGNVLGDLVFRFNYKGRGDSAPWLLDRVVNEEGSPIGYDKIIGVSQLTEVYKTMWEKLPIGKPLRFAEVVQCQGLDPTAPKHRKVVSSFLKACADVGAVLATGKQKSHSRRYARVAIEKHEAFIDPHAVHEIDPLIESVLAEAVPTGGAE